MAKLIVLGQEKTDEIRKENEKNIIEAIMQYSGNDYDAVLRDVGWDLFYQMSSMREGLFNWYPFQKNCEILEISNGFGAITGVLARNAKTVTVLEESVAHAECIAKRYADEDHVTVFAGDWKIAFERKEYDYVIVEEAVNTRYDLEKLLEEVCPFLKETGRLLFVCENRFGMKYWCGAPDAVTHKPFAGIRGREAEGLLTRQELINVLEESHRIKGWNLYYPFPDHKLPQAIYTDRYLPDASVRDRVIPYYLTEERESLVCLENEICDELIANQVFHIFANSFLVECGKSPFTAETVFAALSTDRGKEHGFATVISNHETVQKRVLHPEGGESLAAIHQNRQELAEHGVCCVPEEYRDDMIEMPFIQGKSLIGYLKYLFSNESGKVEEIFDSLYENILRSSEQVPFSECRIKDRHLTEENAGIILKKAYIDMIPYNSFYNDGQIMFYDQEFSREGFPAKYVLFRALRYTYIYIPEADRVIPLQCFKEKYGLAEIWHVFEREEARFVEDNRNYDRMSSFYRWAEVDPGEIDRNIEKLKRPLAETVPQGVFRRHRYDLSAYGRNAELRAVKAMQLKLLKEIARVCEEKGLSYCVFYGTLLGAVRHRGYVPWDDDVDILMPRADYDSLVEMAPEVFSEPYFLQTPENETGCFYGGYSKLRNSNTTGLEERNRGNRCNQGIWIDIFPLDYVLADEEQKREQREKMQFYQRLLLKKTYPDRRMLWDISEQEEETFCKMSKFFTRESLCKELHDTIADYEGEKSEKVAVIARYWGEREYPEYDSKDFEFLIKQRFEDMEVYVPVGYENCLRKDYGDDYAVYPEEWDRKPHHNAVYDTTKSYIDYIAETGYNK